jgi:CO/xanthine dehydrogenase FAD-binding subunit
VYASVNKDKRTKINIRHQDQETKLLNKPISPRRFKEVGAAILQALNKNHHIAILGVKLIKHLLARRLRLPKSS